MIRQAILSIALMLPAAVYAADAASPRPARVSQTAAARADAERYHAALEAAKEKYKDDMAKAAANWLAAANLDPLPEPKLSADPKASEVAKLAEVRRINGLLRRLAKQKEEHAWDKGLLRENADALFGNTDALDAVDAADALRKGGGK